ncbi:hypothetical protein ED312_05425 [Sinomicrobium pectinilyticum]|uniref:Uncharacterized protein n=1 Tax=Sinomicrobium pectinilyticum TaxID=1084421 RepID=A0A3N0ES68_SINP1|nr:hypothetical protein [Sinomicrobium pectinilyticum]RNL90617.1 hypothetical protein ED312_05425 [Sinomicrobium pectinilyticum]
MLDGDPHKEDLIRKAVKESSPEIPSPDFVHHVMYRVEREGERKKTDKPIISPAAWGIIAAMVAGIVFLSLFKQENSWTVDLSFFSFLQISVSPFLWYSVGAIALLVLVQIPLLKIYHSRRIDHM